MFKSFKSLIARFAVLLFAFSLSHALFAQDAASITGVVTDASGAVVPGVQITLANPATGVKYQGVSNAEGSYIIGEVKPGPGYTATFSHEGFTSVAFTGLYLNVNAVRTQNVVLTVGNVVTTVSVSGGNQNVTLDTTDATIGNNFEVQMVNELPVQIRDTPAALFILQPGVTEDSGGQFSVTGARTDQSHVTLDGLDVDDRGTGQFGAINGNAPVDSIQEFRGVTAGETANFDSGGGGQFQLVTKSGTNQFHGDLFEYHRDTDLEANDWFSDNAGVPRAPLIRNQFGGNLGGPVFKNKFFFFFEYNGRRDNQGAAVEQTVPTASYLGGNISYINNGSGCTIESTTLSAPQCISTVSAANVAAQFDPIHVGQDSALASFLGQRYPKGNDVTGGDGINTTGFRFNAPVILKENDYVARIDYNLTPNQKLFARSSALSEREGDDVNFRSPIQFPGDPVTRSIDDASWAWVVGHNWVLGANKTNQVSYGETISRLNFPSLYNPTGALQWGFGPLTAPYLGNSNAQGRVVPVPELRDDFSWVKGVHTFQFGGTFKYITPFNNLVLNDFDPSVGISGVGLTQLDATLRPADINPSSNSLPTANWDSALVFDLGTFTQLDATFNYNADGTVQTMGAGTDRKYRYYETELYFGDTWKASPSLTLSYGVRYQLYSVPYEVNGLEAIQVNADTGKPLGFDEYFFKDRVPQSAAGVSGPTAVPFLEYVLAGKANHNAPGYYSPSYKDFAPRLAFAWNPTFDRRTVLNGSVGIVYDHTIVSAVQNFQDHSSYLFQSSNNNIYGSSSDPEGALSSNPRFSGINAIPTPPTAPTFSPTTIPFVDTTTNPPTPYGVGDNTFSTAIDPSLTTPYSLMVNFGVQRNLGSGFIMNLSYAGRFGRKLLAQVDASQDLDFVDPASGEHYATAFGNIVKEIRAGANPATIPAEPWFENQVGAGGTQYLAGIGTNFFSNGDIGDFSVALAGDGFVAPNVIVPPQFSSNDYYTNKGFSSYHGLLTTLHKNAGHGLQFDFNYTWSHSIDNFSLVANGQSNFTGEFVCDATKPRECRGNSDFDLTQVFNGNFVYDLPVGHGRSFAAATPRWADEIIGGWQVSGLPTWQTGSPYYANTTAYGAGYATLAPAILVGPNGAVSSDAHKDQNTGFVFGFKDPATAAAAFTGPVGLTLGQRNELRSPHYGNFDLGLGKTFPLTSENYRLVFRADAFNAFNHPSFASPNADLISGDFGHITGTTSSARVLQGALRFEF